jgi:hypothetical protein
LLIAYIIHNACECGISSKNLLKNEIVKEPFEIYNASIEVKWVGKLCIEKKLFDDIGIDTTIDDFA